MSEDIYLSKNRTFYQKYLNCTQTKGASNTITGTIRKDKDFLSWLINKTRFLSSKKPKITERLYAVKHALAENPKCELCEKPTNFINIKNGFSKYCCYKCSGLAKLAFTPAEFFDLAKKKSPNLLILDDFKGWHIQLKTKCKTCESEKTQWPAAIVRDKGPGCTKCHHDEMRKSHEQYEKDLAASMPGYTVLEPYISAQTKIFHRHEKCGTEWKTKPNWIMSNQAGCPKCNIPNPETTKFGKTTFANGVRFHSKIEAACAKVIFELYDIEEIEFQKPYHQFHGDQRTCDFYIRPLDLWIEISSFNDEKYLQKIWRKRKIVDNFFFAQTPIQLQQFLTEIS